MVEDIARTVWLANLQGQPDESPEAMIKKLNERYRNVYGQERLISCQKFTLHPLGKWASSR
jgi:hypothetical protein